jgi:hypothetical protein
MKKAGRVTLACTLAFLALIALTRPAHAQDNTIRQPGDHPNYIVEIEPHLDLSWLGSYLAYGTDAGIGLGIRFSIPVVKNGFIPTINNTVAVGFGGDFIYFGCNGCFGVWDLYIPVVMQWNFYVAQRFSVFGEPGLSLNYAFYGADPVCTVAGRNICNNFFPGFVFEVGGRYHINQHLALTARLGFPDITFGVSFM